MKVFNIGSDIGCLRIYDENFAMLLKNGVGDAPFKVIVCESQDDQESKACLKELHGSDVLESCCGIFDVKTTVFLSDHDYVENCIYTFKPGRWNISLWENKTWLIERLEVMQG